MKILLTNWINLLGVFIAVFLYSFINNLNDVNINRTVFQSIFSAFIIIILYGVLFWGFYILSLLLFDLILIVRNREKLMLKLILEWMLISIPFVYWATKHNQKIFIVGVVAFLITQILRYKKILKIIQIKNKKHLVTSHLPR